MDEPYTIKQATLGNLTRYQTSFYSELVIVNSTNQNVVVVNNDNIQTIIPPSANSSLMDDSIMIYNRSGVAATISNIGTPCSVPGFVIKLEKHKFRNNPVYIKEINLVICTEEQAVNVKHPYARVGYEETLNETIEELTRTIDNAPGLRIVANDPSGSLKVLFTILEGSVVKVPVTSTEDTTPSMTIVSQKDGQIFIEKFDLSQLLSGTTNILKFSNHTVPWITSSEICANEQAKTFSWITPETYAELKTKLEKENKESTDQLVSQNAAKVNSLNVNITSLEAEIHRLESERDEYKFRYNSLKSDRQLNLDNMTTEYTARKAQNEYAISNGNVQINGYKLQSAQQESQFKMVHLVMMAALPVLGAMAMKFFESTFKK